MKLNEQSRGPIVENRILAATFLAFSIKEELGPINLLLPLHLVFFLSALLMLATLVS